MLAFRASLALSPVSSAPVATAYYTALLCSLPLLCVFTAKARDKVGVAVAQDIFRAAVGAETG